MHLSQVAGLWSHQSEPSNHHESKMELIHNAWRQTVSDWNQVGRTTWIKSLPDLQFLNTAWSSRLQQHEMSHFFTCSKSTCPKSVVHNHENWWHSSWFFFSVLFKLFKSAVLNLGNILKILGSVDFTNGLTNEVTFDFLSSFWVNH